MLYLDTSVLLAYTLTKTIEPQRYATTQRLFEVIDQGIVKAITSFYALHELLIVAVTNTAPDWQAGSELARDALRAILSTRTLYVPIPRREDKILKARLFSALRDATDLPHAIAAHTAGCTTFVAYDDHFRAIRPYNSLQDTRGGPGQVGRAGGKPGLMLEVQARSLGAMIWSPGNVTPTPYKLVTVR